MLADIPHPWRAFLRDIDALLGSQRSDGPPVELHCEDVQLLSRSEGFDLGMLRERYVREVRPFVTGPVSRHDLTLELWVEMIEELRKDSG